MDASIQTFGLTKYYGTHRGIENLGVSWTGTVVGLAVHLSASASAIALALVVFERRDLSY